MRRSVIIIGASVGALAVAWTGFWFFAADRLESGVQRWAADMRAQRYELAFERIERSGFPFSASVTLVAPSMTQAAGQSGGQPGGPDARGWAWHADAATVELVPWEPSRLTIRNHGVNRIDITTDRTVRSAAFSAAETRLEIEAPSARGEQRFHLHADAAKLALADPAHAAEADSLDLTVILLPARLGDHRAPVAELGLTVAALRSTAPEVPTHLGVTVAATVLGTAAPGAKPAELVAAWRDDGGSVELRQVDITSDTIKLHGNGTLALDREMRPIGAGSADIQGFDDGVDRLANLGQLKPNQAKMAKVFLNMMAQTGSDGVPVLSVPVTGQDGWLSIGPVKVVRLLPIKLG